MACHGPSGPYVFEDHAKARGIVVALVATTRGEMQRRRMNGHAIEIIDFSGTSNAKVVNAKEMEIRNFSVFSIMLIDCPIAHE